MAKRAVLSDHFNYNASARPKTSGSMVRQDARISKIQSRYSGGFDAGNPFVESCWSLWNLTIRQVGKLPGGAVTHAMFNDVVYWRGIYAR